MEIEFIGSGAAHDPKRGNVSILINSESKILLDTGFMNVISYFEKGWDANFIDAIYISHFHADHFFALIPLISKMVYAGRTKKLTLIGQPNLKKYFKQMEQIGELEMYKHYKFEIEFIETISAFKFRELDLDFAATSHGDYINFAIKLTSEKFVFGYSGDGRMTTESQTLFSNCHYIVQNTKNITEFDPNHCNIKEFLDYADTLKSLKGIFLTHIHQKIEREQVADYLNSRKVSYQTNTPEPNSTFNL